MQNLDKERRQVVSLVLNASKEQFNVFLKHLTPEEAQILINWIQITQEETNDTIMKAYGMDEANDVIERIKKL
jgi:hypothetical protein